MICENFLNKACGVLLTTGDQVEKVKMKTWNFVWLIGMLDAEAVVYPGFRGWPGGVLFYIKEI